MSKPKQCQVADTAAASRKSSKAYGPDGACGEGRRQPPPNGGGVARAYHSVEVAYAICAELAAGACWATIANRGRLPSRRTLYHWRNTHLEFGEAVAQAREIALDSGGQPTAADLDHLKGLLMAEELRPRSGTGRGKLRPRRKGKVVWVRYGPGVAREICERLARGEIWGQIAGTGRLPSYCAFYVWKERHPEFAAAVEEARRIAAEARFEKALAVAEGSTPATVQSDKLRVATLLHHAERLDPERFGKAPGGRSAAEDRIQTIVIRRFERAVDDEGRPYVRVIESAQDWGRGR